MGDTITGVNGGELLRQELDSFCVELVLMRLVRVSLCSQVYVIKAYLQVAELGELLATVVKPAGKWLHLLMNNFVCTNVTPLSKHLTTDVAAVGSFSSVAPFVCLEITKLRK